MIGDPCAPVECDKCGEVEYFDMRPLAQRSWDNRDIEKKMKRAHWLTRGEEHFCPECAEVMSEPTST